MLDLFIDWHQQRRISQAESTAAEVREDAGKQSERIRRLELNLDRMTIISQALGELLRERLDVSEEDLLAKVGEIDLRDGTEDGVISTQVIACPKCSRKVSTKKACCIFCGNDVPQPHVFKTS
jgi:hypothetical protein